MTPDQTILHDKYKLGKLKPVPDPHDLLLSNYVDMEHVNRVYSQALRGVADDAVPDEAELGTFDFSDGVTDWMMLLNDTLGDCVPAGIMETQYVLSRLGGHHFERSDQAAERNYSNMGGWIAGEPNTDQGCDLRIAAKVWQKQGVLDANGTPRHSGLYVFLDPGNVPLLFWAVKNLKAAVLGYDLPRSAMEETYQAEEKSATPVWTYDSSSPSEGGHCVPGFGRVAIDSLGGAIGFKSVSWGEPTLVAGDFIENKMDDGFVVVSSSILKEGQVEGLDHEQLLAVADNLEVGN
jgi:hypothetical protein